MASYLKSQYFSSLIFEETPDVNLKKICASAVIYCDEKSNKIQRASFYIYEADINGGYVKKDILSSLQRKNIPATQKIFLSTDTTNVMGGIGIQ